jgi:hypothetical protein
MKKVLIPTDFTPASLQLIHKTVATLQPEQFEIILFHAFDLPFDIGDLLFMGREKIYNGLVSDDFRNQCRKIKNLHVDVIHSISIRYFYGGSVNAFRNFLSANEIDLVIFDKDVRLQQPHQYSIDPIPLLKKGRVEILNSFKESSSRSTSQFRVIGRQAKSNVYTNL